MSEAHDTEGSPSWARHSRHLHGEVLALKGKSYPGGSGTADRPGRIRDDKVECG